MENEKPGGVTDENGVFQCQVVKGLYNVTIEHPKSGEIIHREISVTRKNTEDIFVLL